MRIEKNILYEITVAWGETNINLLKSSIPLVKKKIDRQILNLLNNYWYIGYKTFIFVERLQA